MFGVIVNTIAIVLGAGIGLFMRKGIPSYLTDNLMKALGACTVLIGIQGAIKEENILLLIIAIVLGVTIGEVTDFDGKVNRFTERITSRFSKEGSDSAKIANAFVTSCLIMNVGAMVIVGSLDAGLRADFTMLYTKSLLDFISGIMMAAAMGIGAMGSAGFTLIFQGGIVLFAELIAPFMSDMLIQEMSCTGSLIIMILGLNMIEVTKFKVINYLPALLVSPVLYLILTKFF